MVLSIPLCISGGYKTKKGVLFKVNNISSILRNEKYRGLYTFNRDVSKDEDGKRNN